MYLNNILTDSEGNKCLTIVWTKFGNSDHSDIILLHVYLLMTMTTYEWQFSSLWEKKKNQTTKYFHPAAIFFEKKKNNYFLSWTYLLYRSSGIIFCQSKKETEMQKRKCKADKNIHIQNSTLEDFWKYMSQPFHESNNFFKFFYVFKDNSVKLA